MMMFLCCPFLPREVLDEILDLFESVSYGFSYFLSNSSSTLTANIVLTNDFICDRLLSCGGLLISLITTQLLLQTIN